MSESTEQDLETTKVLPSEVEPTSTANETDGAVPGHPAVAIDAPTVEVTDLTEGFTEDLAEAFMGNRSVNGPFGHSPGISNEAPWADFRPALGPEHVDDDGDNGVSDDDGLAERARQLEERSLRSGNPLSACLGILASQQILLANRLFSALTTVLDSTPHNLDSLERLAKPLAGIQALHRQINHYADTRLRIEELRRKRQHPPLRPEPLRGIKMDDPLLGRLNRRKH